MLCAIHCGTFGFSSRKSLHSRGKTPENLVSYTLTSRECQPDNNGLPQTDGSHGLSYIQNPLCLTQDESSAALASKTLSAELSPWGSTCIHLMLDTHHTVLKKVAFNPPTPSVTVTSSASNMVWRAHFNNLEVHRHWKLLVKKIHINVLELRTIFWVLKSFLPHLQGKAVKLITDNMTKMYYGNKQRGVHSIQLCKEAVALRDWCIHYNVYTYALTDQLNRVGENYMKGL